MSFTNAKMVRPVDVDVLKRKFYIIIHAERAWHTEMEAIEKFIYRCEDRLRDLNKNGSSHKIVPGVTAVCQLLHGDKVRKPQKIQREFEYREYESIHRSLREAHSKRAELLQSISNIRQKYTTRLRAILKKQSYEQRYCSQSQWNELMSLQERIALEVKRSQKYITVSSNPMEWSSPPAYVAGKDYSCDWLQIAGEYHVQWHVDPRSRQASDSSLKRKLHSFWSGPQCYQPKA